MLFCQLPVRAAQSVVVAWDPATATNVAGSKIYSGTASHAYSNVVVVAGHANSGTISGLTTGQTYYFAVTTFDGAGHESGYSAEASYTVTTAPATLTSAIRSGGQFRCAVAGSSGEPYVVQASTNLVNWVPVATNTAPFLFTDTNAAAFSQRFYRAVAVAP